MIPDERLSTLEDLTLDSVHELDSAAQYATAAAYPNGMGSPLDTSRCLNYRMEVRDFRDLRKCLLIIGAYNYFDGDRVAEAFEAYLPAEDVGKDHDGLIVEIGREGSPALHIRHAYYTYGDNEPTIDEDLFVARCQGLAREAKADEYWLQENDWRDHKGATFRLWWD